MGRITAKEVNEKFVRPLMALLKEVSDAADTLGKLQEKDVIPFLPCRVEGGETAVADLQEWVRDQLTNRIEGAQKGSKSFQQAMSYELRKEKGKEE